MFMLQNKEMLIDSYKKIIEGNLKIKEIVFTELMMFVMFGVLEQSDVETLMALYPVEQIIEEEPTEE